MVPKLPKSVMLKSLPDVEVMLNSSARARRYGLRVSQVDGRVTLTVPARGTQAQALAFAEGQAEWLERALARLRPRTPVAFGTQVMVEGQPYTLVAGSKRSPELGAGMLCLPADPVRLPVRLQAFLKHLARQRLQSATEHYAQILGRPFRKITLRDTRSRWGSCSADGSLSYSWRLIMAPPEILHYVAAHEVAHLQEMNHSPEFWAVVAKLRPTYAPERAWLRREGSHLHALRFDD